MSDIVDLARVRRDLRAWRRVRRVEAALRVTMWASAIVIAVFMVVAVGVVTEAFLDAWDAPQNVVSGDE